MSSWSHYSWSVQRKVNDPLSKALLIFIALDTHRLDYRMMDTRNGGAGRPPMETMDYYFRMLGLPRKRGEALIFGLLRDGHLIEHFGYVPAWPEPAPPEPRKGLHPPKKTRIFERDGWKCVYCGSTENLSLDHVKARSTGGGDEDSNLVTACRPCNSSKGNRPLSVWRPGFDLVGEVI